MIFLTNNLGCEEEMEDICWQFPGWFDSCFEPRDERRVWIPASEHA